MTCLSSVKSTTAGLHSVIPLIHSDSGASEASLHSTPAVPYWKGNHHLHCNGPLWEPGQLFLYSHCHW